jgi:hypothetical protein
VILKNIGPGCFGVEPKSGRSYQEDAGGGLMLHS